MLRISDILKDKTIIISTIIYIIIGISLYLLIPYQLKQQSYNQTINEGKVILNILYYTRELYNDYIVNDILKYSNIKFDINHEANNKLPYPATFLHMINKKISKTNDISIKLYSLYPFKNSDKHKLSTIEKKTIDILNTNTTNNAIYTFIETVNNTEYMHIAKTDYMINKTCVKCHNTHPDKTWDVDWKIGDSRGVMEVVIPIDKNIKNNFIEIEIFGILMIMIISFLYYIFNFINIQKKLNNENTDLTNKFNNTLTTMSVENQQLEHNLEEMYMDFDKYVIFSKTDLFGIITDASGAFCNMAGYDKKDLIGFNHNIIRHPDMNPNIFKGMWNTIEKNKVWTGEIKNLKKDGGYYWVSSIVSPIFDQSGAKIGYISIRHDITKRKNKEQN